MLLLLTLTFTSLNAIAAVKIVECEDAEGNRSFQKACPPDSTQVGEKSLKTGPNSTESSSNKDITATLYMVPDCEACDEIREFLGARKIPITEKDANESIEIQKELTELTGALKVPTTIIGEEVLTGYSRANFISALEAAGYKEDS